MKHRSVKFPFPGLIRSGRSESRQIAARQLESDILVIIVAVYQTSHGRHADPPMGRLSLGQSAIGGSDRRRQIGSLVVRDTLRRNPLLDLRAPMLSPQSQQAIGLDALKVLAAILPASRRFEHRGDRT